MTCSLLGGFSKPRAEDIQSLDSGLCSILYLFNPHAHSSALAPLHSDPLDPLALLVSSRSSSPSVSVSDPPVLSCSTPFDFAVPQSMSAWFHHLIGTFAPSFALAPSHRSRSGRVEMYCATVFCLFAIDFRMSVSPASRMAPTRDG